MTEQDERWWGREYQQMLELFDGHRDDLKKCGFTGSLLEQCEQAIAERGEDSAEHLIALYAILAEHVIAEQKRVESSGGSAESLIAAAIACGKIQALIWYKHARDYGTGDTYWTAGTEAAFAGRGRLFWGKKTTKPASLGSKQKGEASRQVVLNAVRRLLRQCGDTCRRKDGSIVVSRLAKLYTRSPLNSPVGYEQARKIIEKAIAEKDLV